MWHESRPTHMVQYCFSAWCLINAAFRMLHQSNPFKSKAIHPKIPNEFLSLKGQTDNRERQSFPEKTKEEEQRKFDCDLHKTINRKGGKKAHKWFESLLSFRGQPLHKLKIRSPELRHIMLQLTGFLKGQQLWRDGGGEHGDREIWEKSSRDTGSSLFRCEPRAPQHLKRHVMSTSDPRSLKNEQISKSSEISLPHFSPFLPPSRPLFVITASDTLLIQHPPRLSLGGAVLW